LRHAARGDRGRFDRAMAKVRDIASSRGATLAEAVMRR